MPIAIVSHDAAAAGDEQTMQLDAIFFASSATQRFSGPAERAAFRERWLGRYLLDDAANTFVAVDESRRIVGYVIGSIVDIARLARFADLASVRQFAHVSAAYPAHLHVNVDAAARSRGVGARLIEAFAVHAAVLGAPGVHVVTAAASRNVRFYARHGFRERARVSAPGSDTVFLGRDFRTAPPAAIKP